MRTLRFRSLKMNCNSIYVTTTIPFVNARPHVGFALELVQADAIARYHRLMGCSTRLQTGTDEHAFKNVLAARQSGVTTEALVDHNAAHFRRLCAALDISHDRFIRTTEPAHKSAVAAFWRLLRSEDLYVKRYAGLYSVGCEDFYLEKDLVDGNCPDHETAPVVVEEENYFFRLSAYQERLERLLVSGELSVVPRSRRNECSSSCGRVCATSASAERRGARVAGRYRSPATRRRWSTYGSTH
jgi:methionyl-tRNA synthetase